MGKAALELEVEFKIQGKCCHKEGYVSAHILSVTLHHSGYSLNLQCPMQKSFPSPLSNPFVYSYTNHYTISKEAPLKTGDETEKLYERKNLHHQNSTSILPDLKDPQQLLRQV